MGNLTHKYDSADIWCYKCRDKGLDLEKQLIQCQQRNKALDEALRQILGWRELRNTNEIPIERIEDIARKALTQLGKVK